MKVADERANQCLVSASSSFHVPGWPICLEFSSGLLTLRHDSVFWNHHLAWSFSECLPLTHSTVSYKSFSDHLDQNPPGCS